VIGDVEHEQCAAQIYRKGGNYDDEE
jgi:hypothetical protein